MLFNINFLIMAPDKGINSHCENFHLTKETDVNSAISLLSHIHTITADFLISKLKEKGFQEFASSHGNILFQLKENGPMKMGDLAKNINRDKSTTTVLVRKLENEGLVSTKTDSADKRSKSIFLTEKGAQYNEITGEISKDLLSTFYKGFSEEEKKDFLSYLNRIQNNFQ